MACPEEIYCEHEWYDARYEKGDTVYVWVVAKAGDAYPLSNMAEVTLGAVDMFTQASAAIALCILSLNLF